MKWRNAPRWFKYGCYSVILLLVITLILIPFGLTGPENAWIRFAYWEMPIAFGAGLWGLIPGFKEWIGYGPTKLPYIFGIATYFIIGSIVGLVIDRVKRNN